MSDDGRLSGEIDILVPSALGGERIDKTVSLVTGVSRSTAAELLAQGRVVVDGRAVRVRSLRLVAGQRLAVEIPPQAKETPVADSTVRFAVVHEDDHLVVVEKPPGLVVHGGAGNLRGTLVNGLLWRYPELAELPRAGAGEAQRPGIVHRLDKGTSGLLVVARTAEAYRSLSRQFREHTAGREYLALVAGSVDDEVGIVEAPIGRSARARDRMAVTSLGRMARTVYQVTARYGEPFTATLLKVVLTTGRTHQVRVHLAAIGHPVIGDDRYGGSAGRPVVPGEAMSHGRFFLHAHRLELEHPEGGRIAWTSVLPPDLTDVLDRMTLLSDRLTPR
ncbi:MAG: RluA family pseudouridine synthase [Acidimicrobiales bacterium]|jgi:23S rRNA pseudouridine1911/1915/1917 synthase